MSEISKLQAYKKKLEGICDENNLVYRFRNTEYPISLTILPSSGVEEQMTLLADTTANRISPDARLVFYFDGGDLRYKIDKDFSISDALFSKLKNLYKNMHSFWLQYFFRNLVERNAVDSMPQIDLDEPDLPPDSEPLDELDE